MHHMIMIHYDVYMQFLHIMGVLFSSQCSLRCSWRPGIGEQCVLEHRFLSGSYVFLQCHLIYHSIRFCCLFLSSSAYGVILNSIQSSVQYRHLSRNGCLMIFQMSPSQVTKQMATLLLVQHLSWGRFGRCCPTLRFPDFACVGLETVNTVVIFGTRHCIRLIGPYSRKDHEMKIYESLGQ